MEPSQSPPPTSPYGMSKLSVDTRQVSSDIWELKLTGELDVGSAPNFEQQLKKVFEQSAFRVVLNMEGTRHVASSGIGIILDALETARDGGGDLIVAAATSKVKKVFELMGLVGPVRFVATVDEALKIFQNTAK